MDWVTLASAVRDFRQARSRARLEEILSALRGQSPELLSYEEVRRKLRANSQIERGLHEIPLDAIVGSVSRYKDFTRTFLPRSDSDQERWAQVKVAQTKQGLPPISVYKIGDVYFVQDGNHRVSIARQMGNETIEGYVTEVETDVPLTPDVAPDDLILKAEYADFLAETGLTELRPEANLSLTLPGRYPLLLEHIEVHRYYMGLEEQREIPYAEAVAHWYDTVYLPAVRLIREYGLLQDFPDRTEADLYVWLAQHRAEVEAALGWEVTPDAAAADLADPIESYRPHRIRSRVLQAVKSVELETEDERWWRERLAVPHGSNPFMTVLVPMSAESADWTAVDGALAWARREGSQVAGLFVVPSAEQTDGLVAEAVREAFQRRVEAWQLTAQLAVESGRIEQLVDERARWADLVVLPAGTGQESHLHRLICRIPCIMLLVPGVIGDLRRLLLVFGEGADAEVARFAALYLHRRWNAPLAVLAAAEMEQAATAFLAEHEMEAAVVRAEEVTAATVLAAAASGESDLIIAGCQAGGGVLRRRPSSAIASLSQQAKLPLLLCR